MERNRSMAAPSHRKKALPAFYQPAERGSSAAKIMAEARRSLRVPATQRPSTPADTHRALFGKSRTSSRPPSVFSIGAGHFSESRPSTAQRLDQLDHQPGISHTHQPAQVADPAPPTSDAAENGVERHTPLPLQSAVIPHPPSSPPERRASGVKKKKSQSRQPEFWDAEFAPLIFQLSQGSRLDPAHLGGVVDQLHQQLRERGCYGRSGGVAGVKKRSEVLKVVFSLLDSSSPSLLVKLAAVIISMEVSGKNLLNVCKLLFSLARTESNDTIFSTEAISGPLVDLLSHCDIVSNSEALVYGMGTVKLLASNDDLRPQLADNGALSLLQSLLASCLQLEKVDTSQSANTENILVQLTGALRNLMEHAQLRTYFLSSDFLPHLSTLLSSHLTQPTITFNISRLLSKLTLHQEFCEALVSCQDYLPLFLSSLTLHHSHPEILVRVCFILGNLTTEDDSIRHELVGTHNALSPLSSLLWSCLDSELTKAKMEENDGTSHVKSPSEEVLIKLVRVLANMSVESWVGSEVASHKDIVEGLLSILEGLPLASYSELTVNTLATLNNLSFHATQDSHLLLHQQRLSHLLVQVLLEDDGEPLLECVRCYGNLSRHQPVRDSIVKSKVDELLVTLLDSSRHELVFASCGVLVNLTSDPQLRASLSSSGGVGKLLDVLRDFGSHDWQLAGLVCQTLWNLSAEGLTSSVACFGNEEVELLLHLLQSYMEEPVTCVREWREYYVPVGTSLLDRVLSHHTQLLPLSHSPSDN